MLRFLREAPASWFVRVQNAINIPRPRAAAARVTHLSFHSTTRTLPGCVVWTCVL